MDMNTLHSNERECFECQIVGVRRTGRYLALEVDPGAIFGAHEVPGQYTVVTFPGVSPRFLAISSAPGRKLWRFLVDPTKGGLEPVLSRLELNSSVQVSYPEGPGYPQDFSQFHNILVICAGSGVASVMGMLEAWPSNLPAALVYAEAMNSEFAWPEELEALTSRAGMDLNLVSNGERIEDLDLKVGAETAVLLCGSEALIDYFTELLVQKGVKSNHIFTNLAWRP